MEKIMQVIQDIKPLDIRSMEEMRNCLNNLTKPLGSLGMLEELPITLSGIAGHAAPKVDRKAIVVMCGDHGVVKEGVSAYPQAVTGLMMDNFVRGKAAINVLARQAGAEVQVIDIGSMLEEVPKEIIKKKVRYGTDNMAIGPAMSKEEAVQGIHIGIETAFDLADQGIDLLGIGEMGIGNTTPASAMTAVFTSISISQLTGRGTGINAAGLDKKIEVIERAIKGNNPNPMDPLDVLCKVGGFEIAGLVGVLLGAAARRIPVVIDGVISGAAALAAYRIEPLSRDYMIASHLSAEPAHQFILNELELKPLLNLEMRLGEGTGAALAFPLIESSTRIFREMATFEELGIPAHVENSKEKNEA
ncbi:nicotinate-nucleotide--dimethylbenzimidazole phosphoribosyltransferase [Metabacillus arenae]|uniref:nicotinate-nucleotide--dimethylbenzimidazole phosphoribosyltransferase n=1 Tax=Metabacillus arenae TaxID=2771434 RepID=UPI001CD08448|nr:nicotinate-nucleotide--dimethylbenzimidazole phosphoribosyltransferase [Metabacillus arenae]